MCTWLIRIIDDLISWLTDLPGRRKRRKRLEENMRYLAECREKGVSPYEGLDDFLKQQEQRKG